MERAPWEWGRLCGWNYERRCRRHPRGRGDCTGRVARARASKRFDPPRGQNLDAGRIHSAQADKRTRAPMERAPWDGAGCAGGIMSAAVDGIRVAEAIAQTQSPD